MAKCKPTWVDEKVMELKRALSTEMKKRIAETARADIAERAVRDMSIACDRWRKRAEIAEATLQSLGMGV